MRRGRWPVRLAAVALAAVALFSPPAAAQTPAPAGAVLSDPRTDPSPPRRRSSGGGEEGAAPRPPDLSADFDPFAPDGAPPPRRPRFDPARPSIAADADPLADLIRNGVRAPATAPSAADEPWRLPGARRAPTLADPPPGEPARTGPAG